MRSGRLVVGTPSYGKQIALFRLLVVLFCHRFQFTQAWRRQLDSLASILPGRRKNSKKDRAASDVLLLDQNQTIESISNLLHNEILDESKFPSDAAGNHLEVMEKDGERLELATLQSSTTTTEHEPSTKTRIVLRDSFDMVNENYRFEIGPSLGSALLLQTVGAGDFLIRNAGPKWFNWIASRWLSGRSRSAIFTIIDIIRRFHDHGVVDIFAKYPQNQIFWALVAYSGLQRTMEREGLMEQYHGEEMPYEETNTVSDAALMETLAHYSVYSSAVYGWKLGYAMKGTTFIKRIARGRFLRRERVHSKSRVDSFWKLNGTISDLSFFLRRTGRSESDVVDAEWGTDTHSPGYVIVRDPERKALVLSVRGTWTLHDILTDLCCTSQEFDDNIDNGEDEDEGGQVLSLSKRLWNWFYPQTSSSNLDSGSDGEEENIPSAHHGMLEAAKWLLNTTQKVVEDELQKNPDYSLVICGHSMGGGVAALLGTMWRRQFPVSVYVYGPPCIAPLRASPPIGCAGGLNITSCIVEGDPFSLLSLGHVAELTVALDRLCEDSRLRERVLQSTMFRRKDDTKRKDSWWILHTLRFLHANSTGEKHYPPGRLLLLRKRRQKWIAQDAKHSQFAHFQVRPSMLDLGKHLPSLYEECLHSFAE
mmetsp:Transcript_15968/g.43965  ORF Transcript_15968/g.43965 Transcript_15968/m.43965 type:complete len:648 (-) Transcript_15968:758-2701(-)